ncbi:MAG TPA: acetyl-CoA carboxylase biotin carboxyl carrier protein [Pyrinomonadaceae bacterium]
MTTSDQDQSQPHGGEHGTGAAAASEQADSGGSERGGQQQRHGRGRRRSGGGGGRPEQQQQRRPEGQPSSRRESGLNMDELRELTELFSAHGLTDFEFENADIRIRLARNPAPAAAPPPAAPGPQAAMQSAHGGTHASAATQPAAPGGAPSQPAAAPEPPEEELHIITAEMVGTFYRAASPTAEPFVKVGSQVEPGTVVCIIEAMKLMNEIEADVSGTIVKIYVENGQPVEYGQPLFGVKK